MSIYSSPLLVKPDLSLQEFIIVTPQTAGWEHLSFSVIRLEKGRCWQFDTSENELALTILGGTLGVVSNQRTWKHIGSRADVFHGMPTTLYLSRHTAFTVQAAYGEVEFACGWAAASRDYPARLVQPQEVQVELRGGENASRQINQMILPGFPCDRLVVVEVYTPSGNWSSYPPHKHDERKLAIDGSVMEADLEEVYFYKFSAPEGFAYQRCYTADGQIDELILAKHNHLVLSPQGYHPVVTAPGYDAYYLNYLAGSDQSLASSDDPRYSWVKETWKGKDPRLPLVNLTMNHLPRSEK
jgi:5-deoxy-glucuronate isomerase